MIRTPNYFEFPKLPGGPNRNYPWTGFGILLPLDPFYNYEANVLICGGSYNLFGPLVTSNTSTTLSSCGLIRPDIPSENWVTGADQVDMPYGRTLADFVHLPDGSILLINGAHRGMAGWDLSRDPSFQALLYLPHAPMGAKWQKLNSTTIPRLYHSTATLLPDGRVMVAGSAPNSPTDSTYPALYQNEYRVEYYMPHYLTSGQSRPRIQAVSKSENWEYNETLTMAIQVPADSCTDLEFNIIQTGFKTHSTGHAQRMVWLVRERLADDGNGGKVGWGYAIKSPPTPQIAPPGWYLLFAVCGGVPSEGWWVQIGGDPALFSKYL